MPGLVWSVAAELGVLALAYVNVENGEARGLMRLVTE
jgi:hypothetical protein